MKIIHNSSIIPPYLTADKICRSLVFIQNVMFLEWPTMEGIMNEIMRFVKIPINHGIVMDSTLYVVRQFIDNLICHLIICELMGGRSRLTNNSVCCETAEEFLFLKVRNLIRIISAK